MTHSISLNYTFESSLRSFHFISHDSHKLCRLISKITLQTHQLHTLGEKLVGCFLANSLGFKQLRRIWLKINFIINQILNCIPRRRDLHDSLVNVQCVTETSNAIEGDLKNQRKTCKSIMRAETLLLQTSRVAIAPVQFCSTIFLAIASLSQIFSYSQILFSICSLIFLISTYITPPCLPTENCLFSEENTFRRSHDLKFHFRCMWEWKWFVAKEA